MAMARTALIFMVSGIFQRWQNRTKEGTTSGRRAVEASELDLLLGDGRRSALRVEADSGLWMRLLGCSPPETALANLEAAAKAIIRRPFANLRRAPNPPHSVGKSKAKFAR
jgi:hypothetical protein